MSESESVLDILLKTILSLETLEADEHNTDRGKHRTDEDTRKAYSKLNRKLRRFIPGPPGKRCTRCKGSGQEPNSKN